MSRHQPSAGADSQEYVDLRDSVCSYCARTIYAGHLRPVHIGSSTSWQCDECWTRTQQRYERMTGGAA